MLKPDKAQQARRFNCGMAKSRSAFAHSEACDMCLLGPPVLISSFVLHLGSTGPGTNPPAHDARVHVSSGTRHCARCSATRARSSRCWRNCADSLARGFSQGSCRNSCSHRQGIGGLEVGAFYGRALGKPCRVHSFLALRVAPYVPRQHQTRLLPSPGTNLSF